MKSASFSLIADLAMDPRNGWSIGSFGAIAEFMRDADEQAVVHLSENCLEMATMRGAMRIAPEMELYGVAWDTLLPDGEGWHHEMAFCVPRKNAPFEVVVPMGPDNGAIRPEDRQGFLYNLGVCQGTDWMAVRTLDPNLKEALDAIAGQRLFDNPDVVQHILKSQPHRVAQSPGGRIEVFQPIPQAHGMSPIGPHTHVLPKLIATRRTHAKTTTIPKDWQPILSLHPPSPWRDAMGNRRAYDTEADRRFAPLLANFATPEDKETEVMVRRLLSAEEISDAWPTAGRARSKARITLRRLTAEGHQRSRIWQDRFDTKGRDGSENLVKEPWRHDRYRAAHLEPPELGHGHTRMESPK